MRLFSAITLCTLFYVYDAETINLNGDWLGSVESLQNPFHVTVPGGIYTDLVEARLIGENLFSDNDVRNRWISKRSVVYDKHFEVNETFLQSNNATLTFHGLDTFAAIIINGNNVGVASNMFVRYRYNVKDYLKLGVNTLRVEFSSPVEKAQEIYKNQSSKYPVPPACVPETYNGECHVNHIRKMQASFSWDWGPAFPSMGIWKDVELDAVNYTLLTDITVDLYHKNNAWDLLITVFVDTVSQGNYIVNGELKTCLVVQGSCNTADIALPLDGHTANGSVLLTISDNEVERWWPNGYGKQQMYPVSVELILPGETMSRYVKVGFRTVELVQEPLASGLSFYFRVNDVPIFAKGSNWIPSSVFPELSADETTLRHLLKSAKEAHMNMLRVWGGGYYESDLFYEIADEYGIMIWQDFMFACGMYPTTDSFLESVGEEVRQNVRRLQRHPSIVLWSGNNENEAALYGNWYGTGNNTVYKEDYLKLYVDVVKTEVEKIDKIRPFVVSSPSDGAFTEENNYLGPDPYSNLYGDVHYYNYVINNWDINQYPRTRFASEYGVQSIPSITTLGSAVAGIEDLERNSTFMKHRQHLVAGYESMENLVSSNFKIPHTDNATNDLISYIYLSQVNQAVSVKVQTESYRQARSELNSLGEGMTMGALYWQLNDVWQAPSWSSIEFGGRWKMLHYHALEFFAPVIITPHVSAANEVQLYVVSDQLVPIRKCSFAVNTYKWNSLTPIHTQNYTGVTIPSNGAKLVASFWLDDYLQQAGCGSLASMRKKCVIEFVLKDENDERIAPYNYIYPAPLKSVTLPLVDVRVKVAEISVNGTISNDSDYAIELRSDRIALFVWLDFSFGVTIKGRFSENGFHMFHGVKTVVFHSQKATTADVIRGYLRVTTLSDIYDSDRDEKIIPYSVMHNVLLQKNHNQK